MRAAPPPDSHEWIGFSLKSVVAILVGMAVLIWYARTLLYGDNSLRVLNHLQQESATLMQSRNTLRNANQRLQKEYFELLQLSE